VIVEFRHPATQKIYRLPVEQVVIYSDDGVPIALSYDHAGLITYGDVTQVDFGRLLDQLKVQALKPEQVPSHG
jgi:hypothetical protein